MVMSVKTRLSTIEVLISSVLVNSYISHNEFALVNNVLREYNDMIEENKKLNTSTVHQRFYSNL